MALITRFATNAKGNIVLVSYVSGTYTLNANITSYNGDVVMRSGKLFARLDGAGSDYYALKIAGHNQVPDGVYDVVAGDPLPGKSKATALIALPANTTLTEGTLLTAVPCEVLVKYEVKSVNLPGLINSMSDRTTLADTSRQYGPDPIKAEQTLSFEKFYTQNWFPEQNLERSIKYVESNPNVPLKLYYIRYGTLGNGTRSGTLVESWDIFPESHVPSDSVGEISTVVFTAKCSNHLMDRTVTVVENPL